MDDIALAERFEAERPRLVAVASQVLGDHAEAEDVVQQAWLRLARLGEQDEVRSLPAWLTTVTTRLCLDRLKARIPEPHELHESDEPHEPDRATSATDPADHVALAETVGVALHVVLDRLTPSERVAFVLHDSFGFAFDTVAAVLDTTTANARKLASRARAKVAQPAAEDALSDWEVVDAFMAAAREGEFARLLELLAPDAAVRADSAAVLAGTPQQIDGRDDVAAFFNGSAHAAMPVFVQGRPGSAWYHRGAARVVFDFTVADGQVTAITFRAAPEVLAATVRREGAEVREVRVSRSAGPARQQDEDVPTDEGEER